MSALTETEARTKLCPLVKSKIGSAEPEKHTNCIASECMAWRWMTSAGEGGPTLAKVTALDAEPEKMGYCGAFGAV